MLWNPFKSVKEKLTRAAPTAPAASASEKTEIPQGAPGSLRDLEKQGLLGKFFRHWKSPQLLRQLKAVAQRMQAEGVNLKDRKAVEAWIKTHQKEIESGEIEAATQPVKPQTYVKTGPEIGRNDPCSCGSGKKYKKCCGAKA